MIRLVTASAKTRGKGRRCGIFAASLSCDVAPDNFNASVELGFTPRNGQVGFGSGEKIWGTTEVSRRPRKMYSFHGCVAPPDP